MKIIAKNVLPLQLENKLKQIWKSLEKFYS
jgi:hypothetical protein